MNLLAKKSKKKKKLAAPKLCVSFDTNVLYTDLAHHLLRRDAKELIQSNSDHSDLKVEWYLSTVVTGERNHQMRTKANELYSNIDSLEKLLGHQLTTRDIVSDRIRGVIDEQCAELGINLIELDADDDDWGDLIRRSVERLPPFDPGSREKGFRDAVIAEGFIQLVADSPKTPTSCQLIFVSGDELVREYIHERVSEQKNVRLLESLDELEGLINTLVSKVPEDKIAEWQKKAQEYFFVKGDESTWFYKEGLRKLLSQNYSAELAETPEGKFSRHDATWYIDAPVFIKKNRRRLHWMTRIRAESKLKREVGPGTARGGLLTLATQAANPLEGGLPFPTWEDAGKATSTIEVYWSVSVSPERESLSRPNLDDTRFDNTDWEIEPTKANALAEIFKRYSPES